jgi:drug/metabolite transporter (DMT)-like permease
VTIARKELIFAGLLLGVAAIWGGAFVVMKDTLHRLDVNSFLALRFIIATAILILLRPQALGHIDRKFLFMGALIGTFLGAGYILQSFGLTMTTVAKTGFITGLYVVFTPLFAALVLRKRINRWQWISVALATLGLALLSYNGVNIATGDVLVFLSAAAFAAHIVALGEWSSAMDVYALTIVQLGTCAVITTLASLKSGFHLPPDHGVWWAIIYTAVFATSVAFIFQTWAQSFMPATTVAVVLTMEVVFAAWFGVWFGHETMRTKILFGGLMVIAAMYLIILTENIQSKVGTEA